MGKTITAVYDGESLKPLEPIDLERDHHYAVRIEEVPQQEVAGGDAWAVLSSLVGTVDAPSDWAEEHDHYLYGTPKRGIPRLA
jgi:AF2212-like